MAVGLDPPYDPARGQIGQTHGNNTTVGNGLPETIFFGNGGGWAVGGTPQDLDSDMPGVPIGNTNPPGPCSEGCRCTQLALRPAELEKKWMEDKQRVSVVRQVLAA